LKKSDGIQTNTSTVSATEDNWKTMHYRYFYCIFST